MKRNNILVSHIAIHIFSKNTKKLCNNSIEKKISLQIEPSPTILQTKFHRPTGARSSISLRIRNSADTIALFIDTFSNPRVDRVWKGGRDGELTPGASDLTR